MNKKISFFIKEIEKSISELSFGGLTISNSRNKESDLKKMIIRLVKIKNQIKLSFIYRYQTKDITKNYDISKGIKLIEESFKNFHNAILFKDNENIEIKINKKDIKIIHSKATKKCCATFAHNKEKKRMVEIKNNLYLKELGVLNSDYEIRKEMYDKFCQIDKYIEIFDSLIKNINLPNKISVIDMGAGKGYLTFALYDYLVKNNFIPKIIGIEFRKDLVKKCNYVAMKCGFLDVSFKEGTIKNTKIIKNDILIALHACDIATDEAIYKGIVSKSKLIICAPCCYRQIRKQFNIKNDFLSFLKHGILEERQAEIITDAIRSLILEMHGYKTKIFEFVSSEHTAKNIMIVGQKTKGSIDKDNIYKKIQFIKKFYGINEHFLEKLLKIDDLEKQK